MRTKSLPLLLSLSLLLLTVTSCKRKPGEVEYKIRFTTNQISWKTSAVAADSTYSGLGDYITSLTPNRFTSRIWTIGYIDTVLDQFSNSANMLQYIDQNPDHLPMDDSSRVVDFSSNITVSFSPVIFGQVNNDNQFEKSTIDFKYFYFLPHDFEQEVSLPSQYRGVSLSAFDSTALTDTLLKANHVPFIYPVYPNAMLNDGLTVIFGETDSTNVLNPNGEFVPLGPDCPIVSPGVSSLLIRSHKYSNMIYNAPEFRESVTMYGELSFDTENLIQVYTGADNLPYTSDDVFVYAPNFWERITARLDVQ